jgi:3-oxoacyl-[acyl-carrier protein] reductase
MFHRKCGVTRVEWLNFKGKTVLVVGGSSGIGNGIAHGFRDLGADVHVWGTRASAEDYAGEEGSDMTGLTYSQVDASDDEQVAHAPVGFDTLDVLVLSQGLVLYRREEFSIEGFRKVVDVNLNSVMACCARFHEMLKASGGSVTVVSSVAAFAATIGNPAYNASKTGTLGLVRTLAQAWARDGIRVNGLAPGLVDTKMTKITTANPERLAERLKGIPAGRLGTPEDMAGVALFLASPMAAYVTGHTIAVDGGRTL